MKIFLQFCFVFLLATANGMAAQSAWVHYDNTHTLVYSNDNLGNRLPDFSFAGYEGGGVAIPTNVLVMQTVNPVSGDNTANIQNAIDAVSALTPDTNGFRGVVLLNPGTYQIAGTLTISSGGVVLRGSGNDLNTGTILLVTGNARDVLNVGGSGSWNQTGSTYTITDSYVPLGATNFHISGTPDFSIGDTIVIQRPWTQTWINAIAMSNYWNATDLFAAGLKFERTVTAINSNQVTIDIPLCSPIESAWTTGLVYQVTDTNRIEKVGIENFCAVGEIADYPSNILTGFFATLDDLKNGWARHILLSGWGNGISFGGRAKWCTAEDCQYTNPATGTSLAAPAAWSNWGALSLFQRCTSDGGYYHVMVVQYSTPGPNVFLNLISSGTHYNGGPHQRWAVGALHDNIVMTADSQGGYTPYLAINNAGSSGDGHGWEAGYSLFYNCQVPQFRLEQPGVTNHYNWIIGGIGSKKSYSDNGIYDSFGNMVEPHSLYLEQLRERLGGAAIENIGYQLFTISASPSLQSVVAGTNVAFTVTVGDPTLMSNIVALSVSGLPAGASASFSTNAVTGDGNAILTITASNQITAGNYTLNIMGANAGLTHTSSVSVIVGSFSLSATPTFQTIFAGSNTTFTVNVMTNNGFTGSVNLGLSSLPAGASSFFSPTSLAGAGSSTLSITTGPLTPPGNYPLTIFGTNGANVSATTVTLTVSNAVGGTGTLLWTDGGSDADWSTAANWTNILVGGYGPPGISNSIIFTNTGAVTDSALTSPGSGIVIPANVNSSVNGNFSIAGLTNFANSIYSSPIYQNLGIANGATLTADGVQIGGFIQYDFGANNVVNSTISGKGATLLVTNGSVIVSQGSGSNGAHDATLDLSGLDNFVMNGEQIKLGTENITRASGIVYLAKTNNLTLNLADYLNDDGSDSPYSGNPGLYLGHNKSVVGNGAQMYLGISNNIAVDYVTIGRGDANGLFKFNPAFFSANPSVYIHGTNGESSLTGVYVVGDNSAGEGSSTFSTNDFSGGTVHALINYLCVGRGRQGFKEKTTCTAFLTFNDGYIYANRLAIGFLYPSGSNSISVGTLNVNGGTLMVASNLTLATRPDVGGSGSTQGTLNINGGTVLATNITGNGGTSTVNLKSGTLDLGAGDLSEGCITSISNLTVGAIGSSGHALLENAASISVSSPIVIAGNGTIAGDTIISSPGLIINGTISPGNDGVGAITNNGTTTFGANGIFSVAVQDAEGAPMTGWDFLQTSSQLNVQSSNANPFDIQLQSFDFNGSGAVTNFSADTNYDWTIAAAANITNFSADKFTVDVSQFQNDLKGGYFYIRTNANSLVLSFTNNHPPTASPVTVYRTGNLTVIPIAMLASNWSDQDGDGMTIADVSSSSTNGVNNVSADSSYIYYAGANDVVDAIFYSVADIRTNPPAIYQPGDTQRTATGEIIILPPPTIGNIFINDNNLIFSGAGGKAGGIYYLLASTNVAAPLNQWQRIATNVFDSTGNFSFTNGVDPNTPARFYLLQLQ